ncbi:MAG: cell division protein FtsZ [Bacteroidales bacterium]|jgi:cell division protein FtsZ|nr:cell division protein FtsZ [Bacteroidales bacterium]MCI1785339.1 cell division protein FtsZ [Bacteroidales bacterium]
MITEEDNTLEITPSDWIPSNSMIKVIGVGGGGCNAVTYMYNQKIQGCSFIVCNTDSQALQKSTVPVKIQLGDKGLGAGTDPTKGRNAALESQDEIAEKALDNGTQMLFITAGMGGGTGTGAAPVIAKMSKEKGILTVAVVTLPFKNEGNESLSKAVDGIHELEKNVDSLLIINNEKLYELYGDQLIQDAFPKADEVLATAVRGITEIISKPGYINVDFEDVKTMMKNSGMALLGCGSGTGPDRLDNAVKGALESPLLNDFDLKTAKNVLINITAGNNENGLLMNDLNQINDKINEYTGNANKFKRGLIWDDSPDIGDTVHITAIATGFEVSKLSDITDVSLGKLIQIDKDFTYKRIGTVIGEEVDIPNMDNGFRKIGYNTSENKRTFNFDEKNKPILIVEPKQNISELENVPAIRRVAGTAENAGDK